MIKVKNITKKISSKMLLKFISFELKPNKITGLLGANGAGKTTLFRSVAGLSSIDTGEIFLGKKEVSRLTLKSDLYKVLNMYHKRILYLKS